MNQDELREVQTVLDECSEQKFSVLTRFEALQTADAPDGEQSVKTFHDLKNKLRTLRTRHEFLAHTENSNATAPTYSGLFPTQAEYTDLELELAVLKNQLRSSKKNRAELQQRVKPCSQQYGTEVMRLQTESERVQLLLRKKRIADQLAGVRAARGNDDAIETLATDSSLMTAAARALNDMLASDKYEMRNGIASAAPRCNQLRAQLEHTSERRAQLRAERDALALQEATIEDADPCIKELKQAADRRRALELIDVRVSGCSLENVNPQSSAGKKDVSVRANIDGHDLLISNAAPCDLGFRLLSRMK